MDPELARYLNRHYWQQKSEEQTQPTSVSTTVPSAPVATAEARMSSGQPPEVSILIFFLVLFCFLSLINKYQICWHRKEASINVGRNDEDR